MPGGDTTTRAVAVSPRRGGDDGQLSGFVGVSRAPRGDPPPRGSAVSPRDGDTAKTSVVVSPPPFATPAVFTFLGPARVATKGRPQLLRRHGVTARGHALASPSRP